MPETLSDAMADALRPEFITEADAPPKQDFEWKPFTPKLNEPTQTALYESQATFILADGPRGGGKTIGGLHTMTKHCTENANALALIIVGVKRQAEEGGAWDKLQRFILPEWEQGQGLDHDKQPLYTEPKTNVAKDVFIWIRNKFGGWSRIVLLSMPVSGHVYDRAKGMEPSFILLDEAQTLDGDVYFSSLVQQLGRRPNVTTQQQIIFCANPAGPSHWLYKRFFVLPFDAKTGDWDERYARFFFPMAENIPNLPQDYPSNVEEATRGDAIEQARMLRGEWIDRPTGECLFKDHFNERLHMRGDAGRNQGLLPVKGHAILVSYDLGAAHTSIHFLQIVPTLDKIYKLYIDELDYVGQYIPYNRLVPIIIDRMIYWDKRLAADFPFVHISDDSAFNQFRAATGSFDATDVEMMSKQHVQKKQLKEKYTIKMKPAPKGKNSIEARVRMVLDGLRNEEILISATCTSTKAMLLNLEEEDGEPLKPKRSPFIHKFDSFSYAAFYYLVGRGRFSLNTGEVESDRVVVFGRP